MLTLLHILPLILLTLVGLCVGSFCNVLILRIPRGEEFVKTPSHCFSCGHNLSWYENIPLVSWLIQGGKCRHCAAPISRQYPIVEGLNGLMWLLTGLLYRDEPVELMLYCALYPVLMVIAVIDWRTFLIPNGLNLAVCLLGVTALLTDLPHWMSHLIGAVSVSGLFLLLHILTGGAGLGMGDVKLMFGAGLLLGGGRTLLAMLIGSLSGSVIHSIRMKRGAGRKLAFGPYLAAGIWGSALFGERFIDFYLGLFGL